MGKINNPITISTQFGIDEYLLRQLGVVNVLLNTDTLLFIDPLLLELSAYPEIHIGAATSYKKRFSDIVKLLSASNFQDDAAWKAAKKLFKFSEISWTCLGYGTSVRGSGFGKDLISTTIDTASQIVKLGIEDPDFFMALALFEEGIGPDRISDMTTNIILWDLLAFTEKINETLKIPVESRNIKGTTRKVIINPISGEPLVFVPTDIVRDLPIASDWSDVCRIARENDELRENVNAHLGGIWATMTRKEKERLRASALSSRNSFEQILELLRAVPPKPYDFKSDRNGEDFWTSLLGKIAKEHPYDLSKFSGRTLTIQDVSNVVNLILEQFKDLIENKGLWKELWGENDKPRKEKAAQRLFFAVAISYCRANNLDLTPEADAGNGPVDFKVSQGANAKIIVEIKLSTNTSLIHGYEKQLEIYKAAEDTDFAIFLLIDVGMLGNKYNKIQSLRRDLLESTGKSSTIYYIDGNQRASASKR
jgi:hypothetical protein